MLQKMTAVVVAALMLMGGLFVSTASADGGYDDTNSVEVWICARHDANDSNVCVRWTKVTTASFERYRQVHGNDARPENFCRSLGLTYGDGNDGAYLAGSDSIWYCTA